MSGDRRRRVFARQAIAVQVGAVDVEPQPWRARRPGRCGSPAARTAANGSSRSDAPPRGRRDSPARTAARGSAARSTTERPVVEHEPQRLDWSRTEMRLMVTPSLLGSAAAGRLRDRAAPRGAGNPRHGGRHAAPRPQRRAAPRRPRRSPVHTVPRSPGPMHDAMLDAAQRQHRAVGEGRRLRQTAQPRRDPAAVLLRERLGLADAAARRHGEDHFAGRGMNAQRVAARADDAGACAPDRSSRSNTTWMVCGSLGRR